MNKTLTYLQDSPSTAMTTKDKPGRLVRQALLWLMILGFVLYSLPWLMTPGAALTLNGFDLAEWVTLHPPVPDRPTPMTIALFIRLPLLVFTWNVALASAVDVDKRMWWLRMFFIVFLIAMQMPPLEFLTSETGNANYQQQAILALVAFLGSLFVIVGVFKRWWWQLMLALSLGGIAAAVFGLLQARDLFIGFSMPVSVGPGGVGVVAVLLFTCILLLRARIK